MNKEELKSIVENLIDTFKLAGMESIRLFKEGLKIEIKEDNSPVSNGDLKVNELITNKISQLTPNIPIISEETVDLSKKNKSKIFWLIDPIDGTKEYIAGKDEYTLNAALVIKKCWDMFQKKIGFFFLLHQVKVFLLKEIRHEKLNVKNSNQRVK